MNIEFFCTDENVLKYWPPQPASNCIPEEISNLDPPKERYKSQEPPVVNIKSCMPAMDYLTSGYIIYNAYEVELETVFNSFKETIKIKTAQTINQPSTDAFSRKSMAVFERDSCPMNKHDVKIKQYFKFRSMWSIKTPPGYSCIVMQPFYLPNNEIQILPGIIDTDSYHLPISVTGYVISKDKFRISPGTPLLQVIPFKRDDWEMSVSNNVPPDKSKFFIWNTYKRLSHAVKKYI
jgi:hypothetical protein